MVCEEPVELKPGAEVALDEEMAEALPTAAFSFGCARSERGASRADAVVEAEDMRPCGSSSSPSAAAMQSANSARSSAN